MSDDNEVDIWDESLIGDRKNSERGVVGVKSADIGGSGDVTAVISKVSISGSA